MWIIKYVCWIEPIWTGVYCLWEDFILTLSSLLKKHQVSFYWATAQSVSHKNEEIPGCLITVLLDSQVCGRA